MDPRQFDELTKTLATTTSRRQALKAILAGVAGGVFGLSAINVASAQSLSGNRAAFNAASTHSLRRNHMAHTRDDGPGDDGDDGDDGGFYENCKSFNSPCTKGSECCSGSCTVGYCD